MANSAYSTKSATTATPTDASVTPAKIASTFGGFIRNKLVNGNFDVWQRATSFSTPSNAAYTADRWRVNYDGTIGTFTVSRQSFTAGQTSVPNEPAYYLQWNHTSAGSGSTLRNIEQRIEDVRTLAGQQCVFTFYAKADSARTVTVTPAQNFGSGGSTEVAITPDSGASCALTTSWQKFTCVFTCPSISGKTIGTASSLRVTLALPINTTMTIDVAQAQVEIGNAATPFEIRHQAMNQEQCDRYYQIIDTYVPAAATPHGIQFKSTMRSTPTAAGGGSGFATSVLTKDGAVATQTTGAAQTLTFEAEI